MLEGAIILALAIAHLVYIGLVVLLLIEEIIAWFDRVKNRTPYDVGFTVAEALENGQYKVVQGVFNKKTNKVTTGREMTVGKLDNTLRNYHRNDKVVVYS